MRNRLRHLRERFPLAALGIEVFSIVLAVLLALTVDEWREELNNRQLAEAALTNIRREIESNRALLEDRYPYHRMVRDSLSSLASSVTEDMGLVDIALPFPRGGRFFDLSAAAYKTAQSSGALSHVNYDALSLLMAIYEEQESLESHDRSFGTVLFYHPQNLQPGHLYYTIILSAGLINDVANSEKELLELYDDFLEQATPRDTPTPTRADSARPDTVDREQP